MHILMVAINPLFPQKVIGGSTKHLHNVAVRLGELGHDVTILSTRRPDTNKPFRWHERVWVKPVLQFKQPFPQPYDMPGFKLANNIRVVSEHLASADRYYNHDGEFLFPPIYADIPAIVSLRDNVYPETMLGSFLFSGDVLITIAAYSRRVVLAAAGQVYPDLHARTLAIPNGIDFALFRPKTPDPAIFDLIPINPANHTVLLHPHRPEPSKGLPQTIAVVDRLVHEYGITDALALVPRWFDAAAAPDVREFQAAMESEIAARGLTDHFLFHDWIPQPLMPDYYNMGDLLLALGHFVEAFGNTVYESLACGTPSLASRTATHRSLLPDHLLDKVHFDDNETAARLAAEILRIRPRPSAATLAYLKTHYDVEAQLSGYTEAILTAEKLPPLIYRPPRLTDETPLHVAPWVYQWGDGMFYHDFAARHRHMPALAERLARNEGVVTVGEAGDSAETWLADGYLTVGAPL